MKKSYKEHNKSSQKILQYDHNRIKSDHPSEVRIGYESVITIYIPW